MNIRVQEGMITSPDGETETKVIFFNTNCAYADKMHTSLGANVFIVVMRGTPTQMRTRNFFSIQKCARHTKTLFSTCSKIKKMLLTTPHVPALLTSIVPNLHYITSFINGITGSWIINVECCRPPTTRCTGCVPNCRLAPPDAAGLR